MFTFRPPSKNGNGHKNGNGNGNGHSNGQANGNGNGHTNGNGHANGSSLTSVLFGNGQKAPSPRNGNGNGHSHKIESVLGPGIHFKGNLSGTGGIRIEGTFDGNIAVNGPVVIADGAKVTADVTATAVTVGGSLQGNITAGKVTILATGRVWGDLTTGAFATEEGAYLRGQVRMEDEPLALAAPMVEEGADDVLPV
jgi:cytoskeletal protein CcmA (bactofilin family)